MTLTTLLGAALCAPGTSGDHPLDYPRSGASIAERLDPDYVWNRPHHEPFDTFAPDVELSLGLRQLSTDSNRVEHRALDGRVMLTMNWSLGRPESSHSTWFDEEQLERTVDCFDQMVLSGSGTGSR